MLVDSVGPSVTPTPSWWLDRLAAAAPLDRLPASADVVIIGGGMTGCATAHWLHRSLGQDCLVLDARGVAGGATGRNGGHLWPRPESTFETQTAEELLAFIHSSQTECDLTVGAGTAALERREPLADVAYHDSWDDMEASGGEGDDWGGDDVATWGEDECRRRLGTEAFSSASHFPGGAQFFPAKVAAALLQHSGATLAAPVRVQEIIRRGARSIVRTDVGSVEARAVVVATNGCETSGIRTHPRARTRRPAATRA